MPTRSRPCAGRGRRSRPCPPARRSRRAAGRRARRAGCSCRPRRGRAAAPARRARCAGRRRGPPRPVRPACRQPNPRSSTAAIQTSGAFAARREPVEHAGAGQGPGQRPAADAGDDGRADHGDQRCTGCGSCPTPCPGTSRRRRSSVAATPASAPASSGDRAAGRPGSANAAKTSSAASPATRPCSTSVQPHAGPSSAETSGRHDLGEQRRARLADDQRGRARPGTSQTP